MTNKRRPISRRDFLKLACAAGGSLAGRRVLRPASRTVRVKRLPVLAEAGRSLRPWWVRRVEQPTIEIAWDRVRRFDSRDTVRGSGLMKYFGEDEVERLARVAADNEHQRLLDAVPGYSLKELALNAAQNPGHLIGVSFLGRQLASTPEQRGVSRWTGTPDEAARIVRAAMRHFGAALVGFVELDERTRKLIYSHDPDGKRLEFEEVDQAHETDEARVIPNRAQWVIVYAVQMSGVTLKRAPTVIAEQTTSLAYVRGALIQNQTQEFLRGLGYQCLGEAVVNGLGIAPGFAVMAGLGEMSRLNRVITPEYGPMVRLFLLITDLPLAADGPIDAGIMEFCRTCKKCAETCPASALSFDDGPAWEARGGWNNPGHKAYFEDSVKCYTYWREKAGTNCGICFAVCPFSKEDKAWIHRWVKAGISEMPVLDGFLRSMDDAFSYGAQKDPEAWWSLDLPEYGIDTERTVQDE